MLSDRTVDFKEDSPGFEKEIFGTDCSFGTARGAIKIATTLGSKLLKEKTFFKSYLFMLIYLSMLQVINEDYFH